MNNTKQIINVIFSKVGLICILFALIPILFDGFDVEAKKYREIPPVSSGIITDINFATEEFEVNVGGDKYLMSVWNIHYVDGYIEEDGLLVPCHEKWEELVGQPIDYVITDGYNQFGHSVVDMKLKTGEDVAERLLSLNAAFPWEEK